MTPRTLQFLGFLAVSLLMLSACDQLFSSAQKPAAKPAKISRYDASAFAEALSVARIVLANGGTLSDIAPQQKIIETFSKQKKTKPANVTIVVLEYKNASDHKQRALSPINNTALSNVMEPLNSTPYKLQEIKVLGTKISPGIPISLGRDPLQAREMIEARHDAFIHNGYKLPALAEAKQQVKLLKYFMEEKNRDASYIIADNAKRALSGAQDKKDAAEANQLAKELEQLEGELRKAMPY